MTLPREVSVRIGRRWPAGAPVMQRVRVSRSRVAAERYAKAEGAHAEVREVAGTFEVWAVRRDH